MFDNAIFEERLKNFQPEPLVPKLKNRHEPLETSVVKEDANNIDLAKVNYLNFLNNDEIKKASEETIRKYGIGTCGPRSFYGTTDLHLELENRLADFLQVKEVAVYAYGFVAVSTAYSFYFRKDTTIFVGEDVNFPIQQSLKDGRGKVVTFAHDDAKDFKQKVLQELGKRRHSSGKFMLVLEAISWNTGKICPLPDFVEITEEFKIRLFLEESHSLGVLGPTGRGLLEYYNIDPNKVDSRFGTLEGAFGSVGGFCTSSNSELSEIQRYRSSGFTFSASMPTYLAQVVFKALALLEDRPEKFSQLAKTFHTFLKEECGFNVVSDPECPFKLIKNRPQENRKIHQYCKKKRVHFICNEDGLMINLNIGLLENRKKLEKVYEVFRGASKIVK